MELREKVAGLTRAAVAPQSELYNGAGEGLSRAFELALTPAIIGGFGYLLDRWLGLLPVLTIVFFLVAMAGLMARMWYRYDARMKEHESTGPWAGAGPQLLHGTHPSEDLQAPAHRSEHVGRADRPRRTGAQAVARRPLRAGECGDKGTG